MEDSFTEYIRGDKNKMNIKKLNAKVRNIKLRWGFHSLLPTREGSRKIHEIHNELEDYGYWKDGEFYIHKAKPKEDEIQ